MPGSARSCSQIQSRNGSSFDTAAGREYARRRLGRQRPPDRLAMQPRPLADLADRQPLDAVHAPDLRPLLHADHTTPPRPIVQIKRGSGPGRTNPTPRQVGHFSTGAGGSLFRRRPHLSPAVSDAILRITSQTTRRGDRHTAPRRRWRRRATPGTRSAGGRRSTSAPEAQSPAGPGHPLLPSAARSWEPTTAKNTRWQATKGSPRAAHQPRVLPRVGAGGIRHRA